MWYLNLMNFLYSTWTVILLIKLIVNKQIHNKDEQKIIIKYGVGKSGMFYYNLIQLKEKMKKKPFVIFLIDKIKDQFIQIGKCLVSLEMFSDKIEEKFHDNEEYFKRQFFMLFDQKQQPIGQVDISISLVQKHLTAINKKNPESSFINNNNKSTFQPNNTQRTFKSCRTIQDEEIIEKSQNVVNLNNQQNVSFQNNNLNNTKFSKLNQSRTNNNQSRVNNQSKIDINNIKPSLLNTNQSTFKQQQPQQKQKMQQFHQDKQQTIQQQNNNKQEKGLLKNIIEGNFCPPAMFFVNNQQEEQEKQSEDEQIQLLEERTIKVDPPITVQQNNADKRNVGKKIFQVEQQLNDYQSVNNQQDNGYVKILDKFINDLIYVRNHQHNDFFEDSVPFQVNHQQKPSVNIKINDQQFDKWQQQQSQQINQEQQKDQVKQEQKGEQGILEPNNYKPKFIKSNVHHDSASQSHQIKGSIGNGLTMNQTNIYDSSANYNQSYADDFENVSQSITLSNAKQSSIKESVYQSQLHRRNQPSLSIPNKDNMNSSVSYSQDFSQTYGLSVSNNKVGQRINNKYDQSNNNQIYEDDFESEHYTSSNNLKGLSYSNSHQLSMCLFCNQQVTNKIAHMQTCTHN